MPYLTHLSDDFFYLYSFTAMKTPFIYRCDIFLQATLYICKLVFDIYTQFTQKFGSKDEKGTGILRPMGMMFFFALIIITVPAFQKLKKERRQQHEVD